MPTGARLPLFWLMKGPERDKSVKPKQFHAGDEDLNAAVEEFKGTYERFTIKYGRDLAMIEDEDITSALQAANDQINIRDSARSFESQISIAMVAIKGKQKIHDARWTGRLSNFLAKLYPLAQTALQLTSGVADVS